MNEQDTAAADAILLMEAEEKVKLRILQVIHDVVDGTPDLKLVGWSYKDLVAHINMMLLNNTMINTTTHIRQKL